MDALTSTYEAIESVNTSTATDCATDASGVGATVDIDGSTVSGTAVAMDAVVLATVLVMTSTCATSGAASGSDATVASGSLVSFGLGLEPAEERDELNGDGLPISSKMRSISYSGAALLLDRALGDATWLTVTAGTTGLGAVGRGDAVGTGAVLMGGATGVDVGVTASSSCPQ